MVKVSETDIAFPEAMLENSSEIFKGLESLIPHQRSAGVTQRGLLGTVGLVWEDEDALQGILSAGHTYRRVLHPKTWVCGRQIRGAGGMLCEERQSFPLMDEAFTNFPIFLFLEILFPPLKPIAAFSYPHPDPNPTKFLCSPQLVWTQGMFSHKWIIQRNSESFFSVRAEVAKAHE